jgi:hypothetical protein
MKVFTRAQVTAKIEHFIKQHGNATAACEALGIFPYQMHIARRDKGSICPQILAAIGVQRSTFYVDEIDPATQEKYRDQL